MPDLSLEACHRYWYAYTDSAVYRVLSRMESVESWTLDGDPNVEESVLQLGKKIDILKELTEDQKHQVMVVCGYIKSSRSMMILQSLDSVVPGAASKIIQYAEKQADDDVAEARLFVNRNIAFERLRLLTKVMSPERLKFLTEAMEKAHE